MRNEHGAFVTGGMGGHNAGIVSKPGRHIRSATRAPDDGSGPAPGTYVLET